MRTCGCWTDFSQVLYQEIHCCAYLLLRWLFRPGPHDQCFHEGAPAQHLVRHRTAGRPAKHQRPVHAVMNSTRDSKTHWSCAYLCVAGLAAQALGCVLIQLTAR